MPDARGVTGRVAIRPAQLFVVAPGLAHRVAAPAYDTLPVDARTELAADPLSYLNILRTPVGAGVGADAFFDNRRALEGLLGRGVYETSPVPRFAWYRLSTDDHAQTGLIAEVAIDDYESGRIVRHEHTRADREEQLAAYQQAVAADASPVALAFRADEQIRALGRRATAGPPHVRFTADDGVEHALWTTEDPALVDDVAAATAGIDRLYITDGHHRFAAAARVAADRRAAGGAGDAADQWLLAALFPDDELQILPFHRAVARPRSITTQHLRAELAARVDVQPLDRPQAPQRSHSFSTWLDGQWYQLTVAADDVDDPPGDPLAALEVTVLQRHVLSPVLGVVEPRLDPRLTYVAGDPDVVAAHCRRERAIGFMVRPTTMRQLMTVADADLVMPPKSTLFAPKTRSGIVLRLTG